MEDPTLFVLTVLFILGTPGPTNTLLATSGAAAGLRRSLPLLPAEAAGYFISILVIGLVLGPVVAQSPLLATGLRLAVGAYLCWLAVRLWRQGGVVADAAGTVRPHQVFVTTLLNPKAIVFALGVVPFASPHAWAYMLGFMAILAAVGLGWILAGTGLGRVARGGGHGRLVPRLGATAIGCFAVLIAILPLLR